MRSSHRIPTQSLGNRRIKNQTRHRVSSRSPRVSSRSPGTLPIVPRSYCRKPSVAGQHSDPEPNPITGHLPNVLDNFATVFNSFPRYRSKRRGNFRSREAPITGHPSISGNWSDRLLMQSLHTFPNAGESFDQGAIQSMDTFPISWNPSTQYSILPQDTCPVTGNNPNRETNQSQDTVPMPENSSNQYSILSQDTIPIDWQSSIQA